MKQDAKGQEIKQGYTIQVLVGDRIKYYTVHAYKGKIFAGRINSNGVVRRIPLKDLKSENILIINKYENYKKQH